MSSWSSDAKNASQTLIANSTTSSGTTVGERMVGVTGRREEEDFVGVVGAEEEWKGEEEGGEGGEGGGPATVTVLLGEMGEVDSVSTNILSMQRAAVNR